MKVKIGWLNKDGLEEFQEKKFKDELSAVQWCILHQDNITMINDTRYKIVYHSHDTFVSPIRQLGYFEIMLALRKGEKRNG